MYKRDKCIQKAPEFLAYGFRCFFLCFHVKRCRVIPVIPFLCLMIARKALYLLAFLALFSCDTSCDICPENRRFLSLFGFRFVHPESAKKPHKHWIFQQLCGLSKSGAEGNRTPWRGIYKNGLNVANPHKTSVF